MATITVETLRCAQCRRPRSPDRSRYCSKRCANRARRKRQAKTSYWPYTSRRSAFEAFDAAADPKRRGQVPETPEKQAQAQLLIARGAVTAYRNRQGQVRDIGVPRDPAKHAGKVWTQRPRQLNRVRDSRERAMMLHQLKRELERR